MLLSTWLRELARGRFRVHPLQYPLVASVSLFSVFNSLGRPLESLIFGRRAARTRIEPPPVFIVGHWRSGTTLLHELLALDERFTSPSTYECFVPNHFLISAWLVKRFTFLLPRQRPMDNMLLGWDRPQEDEFALCNMGLPSPYLQMMFPNEPERFAEYLDMENLPLADLARWQEGLVSFLRRVTLARPGRLILKSPTHLGRVRVLADTFPGARFIHIVRDPHVVFPSTLNLWRSHYAVQSLQKPNFAGFEDYVFRCFERMYRAFEAQRGTLEPGQLHELRYEELVRDPIGQVREIYERLELGGFDAVLPALEKYLTANQDYQTNRYQIESELRDQIDRRWGPLMRRYGYCQETPAAAAMG